MQTYQTDMPNPCLAVKDRNILTESTLPQPYEITFTEQALQNFVLIL